MKESASGYDASVEAEIGLIEDEKKKMSEALSKRLNQYLARTALTEKQAAGRAGIKTSTFNSWIRKVSYPDLRNQLLLSRLLGIPHCFLGLDPDRTDSLPGGTAGADEGAARRYMELGGELIASGRLESANALLESFLKKGGNADAEFLNRSGDADAT